MSSNKFKVALGAAILSAASLVAAPAMAQSIAYADPATAIAFTEARKTAYQQISQTYASNINQMVEKSNQRQELLKPIDKNNDGQVDQDELDAASAASKQQIANLENEIEALQQPVMLARIYVVEQINDQYDEAQTQVVRANKIAVILKPGTFHYMPREADVTGKLTDELNKRVPSVQTQPPQDWNPLRRSVSLYGDVAEVLQLDAYLNAVKQAREEQGVQPASSGQSR